MKPAVPSALGSRGAAHATAAQALQRARADHATTARQFQAAKSAHAATAHQLQRAQAGDAITDGELRRAQNGHATTARELQRAQATRAAKTSELRENGAPSPSPLPRGVRERLAQALEQVPPGPPPSAPTTASAERGEAPVPTSRVESALALVQRIEVFLRSHRPALELSVGGAFQAEVLLERTGPREVAVTVRGKNGPPPPQELARLREELRRRGLTLSSLGIR